VTAPRIKAVLFDLDGTLVHSNEAHVEVWGRVFRDAGHVVAEDAIRGQIGKGGDLFVPTLLPHVPKDERERLDDEHGQRFKAGWLPRIAPFPRAHDLLARVHASGRKVVFASSASGKELDHYLELLDAKRLVDAKTSIDDVETSKPAPDIFGAALKKAGVAADEALVVGDTPFDIEGATRAGIATVAVRSGGFTDDALAGAVAIYDDAADLLARFDESPLAA